ncbi:MAG: extracellular solute-binding protein, partial [Chloroflexota bacterium]|nr:extracellular solute-binding protein [Chloroflexota bacterium]
PEGTPGATPEGTPGATPEGTPGATPEGTPGAVASPPSGASGNVFAFGVTFEQADEIGQVRIEYFRELNPDVNLTVSESSFDEAAFLTALQSNEPPDVVVMDTSLLGTYVARGVLAPLDDCFAQHGVDTATFYEAPMTQATIDGQIYGAPEFMTTMNWLINESAFTDADLDPANFDFSDWDAIRQANEQTMQVDGQIAALGIDPKVPEFLPLWAKANGVDLLSEDGTTAQLDQPEVVEALQLAVDLIEAHGGPNPFLDFRGTWDFFGEQNQFATDQVAAHPMEQWYLNVLAGASPDADVLASPFVDRQGNGLTFATGSSVAVTSSARNPEAACAFAVTVTHQEAWIRAAQERKRLRDESGEANTGVFTANIRANERIFSEVVPVDQMPAPFGDHVQVYLDNWVNAFALPASPANAAIFFGNESILAQAVARALEGEDAQTVLTEANEDAQTAIDRAAE